MKPNFNASIRQQGRLGFIVPSTNTNLEPDCNLLVPTGVTAHFTRIGGYGVDTVPDAVAMRKLALSNLAKPIDLLMAAKADVIGYACVSTTLSHGWLFDRRLCKDIEAKSGVPAVTAAGAMVEALQRLDISSIGFASPYVEELNHDAVLFFESAGIDVANCANIGSNLSSVEQGKLKPYDAFNLGCAANHHDAEAIVIGCTDFRAVEAIEALENELGKPIITSNHAMVTSCLSKINVTKR